VWHWGLCMGLLGALRVLLDAAAPPPDPVTVEINVAVSQVTEPPAPATTWVWPVLAQLEAGTDASQGGPGG